jgi:putative cell wall-binding protein
MNQYACMFREFMDANVKVVLIQGNCFSDAEQGFNDLMESMKKTVFLVQITRFHL